MRDQLLGAIKQHCSECAIRFNYMIEVWLIARANDEEEK